MPIYHIDRDACWHWMGVYAIRNFVNGRAYIGCSDSIGKRWEQHIQRLEWYEGRCGEGDFEYDFLFMDLYGGYRQQSTGDEFGQTFEFLVLELCRDNRDLFTFEDDWCHLWRRTFPDRKLYNKMPTSRTRPRRRIIYQTIQSAWYDAAAKMADHFLEKSDEVLDFVAEGLMAPA